MEPLNPVDKLRRIDPFLATITDQYMKITGFDTDSLLSEINVQFQFWKSAHPVSKLKSCKLNTDAVRFRDSGNAHFKKQQYQQALCLYTKSVASAIDCSEELALAYANRSAVLFELGKYAPCLLDINRALNGEYPENLREKLCGRMEQCLTQIKETNGILVEDNGINSIHSTSDGEWRKKCNFGNAFLPNSSPKIQLKCDKKWGQYTIAVKDIEPGEVLSVEEFLLLIVWPERQFSNCSYCLSKCDVLIPCPSCTQMMYCSKNCRTCAFNSYHCTECQLSINEPKHVADWLQKATGVKDFDKESIYQTKNVLQLSVRALLVGTKQGSELENLMKTLTIKDIFEQKPDPSNKPFANDYLCALKILRTFDKPIFRLRRNISLAVKVTVELRHLFYSNLVQDRFSDCEIFCAMLLFNHLCSIRINTFGINQMMNANFLGDCEELVGAGVCVLHNLLNHSSNPNTRFLVQGREHVLFAARPIKQGEQIFSSFYNTFLTCTYDERMYNFIQYGFICECEACTNKWPLLHDLQNCKIEFLDRRNKNQQISKLLKISAPVVKKGVEGLSDPKIIEILSKIITWLHTNLKSPAWSVHLVEETFSKFMMIMHSNLYNKYMTQIQNGRMIEGILENVLDNIGRS